MAGEDALGSTEDILGVGVDDIPADLPNTASAIPISDMPDVFVASSASPSATTVPPEYIYQYQSLLDLASYTYRL